MTQFSLVATYGRQTDGRSIVTLCTYSPDINMTCLDMVVMNGIPLTYITSTSNSIKLYLCMLIGGRNVNLVRICAVAFHVVFPFNDHRFPPSISSADTMSTLRMGQLSITEYSISTILIKSLALGLPIISCSLEAARARE